MGAYTLLLYSLIWDSACLMVVSMAWGELKPETSGHSFSAFDFLDVSFHLNMFCEDTPGDKIHRLKSSLQIHSLKVYLEPVGAFAPCVQSLPLKTYPSLSCILGFGSKKQAW